MVPDVAPDDGMQPEPQFNPPHVRLGGVGVVGSMPMLHLAVKPLLTPTLSDVKVIMRKPVEDV